MRQFLAFLFLVLFSCSALTVPQSSIPEASYPEWAHSHWVWLSSSEANQTSEIQLVDDYLSRDIPVGAVDIDSQWATGDNNFVWNTNKYPNPQQMIDYFHSENVRVILWTTSLIDTDSPNYQEGLENHYYLNTSRFGGHVGTVNWWHGTGAFIDYTNPEGLNWWHQQMDNVLDMGVDGWKCDGTDPYTFELYPIQAYSGEVTERDYANSYYGDFFNYTRTKNSESLIMSRPVDSYYGLYWSFSPHYVMYSGWVGDQDPTFDGLRDALRNMYHSAWRNYTNFGSDIGGYRSGDRTKELFIRWAQLGAFVPLMENGGNGEHRPWMFDNTNQTLNIYRQFVSFHYELMPYFLNAGSTSMEQHIPVMYPQSRETLKNPTNWGYILWKDIFVYPITSNDTEIEVIFPQGSDQWIDWFDSSKVYQGGTKQTFTYPLETYPVFIRKGAMLALDVSKDLNLNHGDEHSVDYQTVFIPYATESGDQTIRRWKQASQELSYKYQSDTGRFSFLATAHERSMLIVMHNVLDAPQLIEDLVQERTLPHLSNKEELNHSSFGWVYVASTNTLWIKPGASAQGTLLNIDQIFFSDIVAIH